MTTENQDLTFRAGSDFVVTVAVTGLVSPRTIVKATYTIMDPDTGQPLLTKTEAGGIQITAQPPAGELTITFVPADTADLVGDFQHQVRIEDDLGIQAPPILDGILSLGLGAPLAGAA